jgi:hypothetical protein
MAESNLRSLLATARSGGNATKHDAPVGDAEMAAILGVLRGDEENESDGNGSGPPPEPAGAVDESPSAVEQPPTAAG